MKLPNKETQYKIVNNWKFSKNNTVPEIANKFNLTEGLVQKIINNHLNKKKMPKVNCSDCVNFVNEKCTKESKNGYNNCKKFKAIPLKDLISERNKLLISKCDPKRLEFLTAYITNLNGGTL